MYSYTSIYQCIDAIVVLICTMNHRVLQYVHQCITVLSREMYAHNSIIGLPVIIKMMVEIKAIINPVNALHKTTI